MEHLLRWLQLLSLGNRQPAVGMQAGTGGLRAVHIGVSVVRIADEGATAGMPGWRSQQTNN